MAAATCQCNSTKPFGIGGKGSWVHMKALRSTHIVGGYTQEILIKVTLEPWGKPPASMKNR